MTSPPPRLYALGSINVDIQVRVASRVGERETERGSELRVGVGGKAVNAVLIASRLGHPAVLLGRIGGDDLGVRALESLRRAGVDIADVRVAAGESTGVAMIAVPPDGKKQIVLAGEANLGFDAGDTAAVVARIDRGEPGSLLVADYEVSASTASAAVAAALRRGMPVVVDPSFPDAVPRDDLRHLTAITPNVDEAFVLAGMDRSDAGDAAALASAARRLAALGPRLVCLKMSDGGCIWCHDGEVRQLAPLAARVVDATGAGDAFTAALAVALFERRPVDEAVRRAVAASELAVGVYASQPSRPGSRDELDARVGAGERTERRLDDG